MIQHECQLIDFYCHHVSPHPMSSYVPGVMKIPVLILGGGGVAVCAF